VVMTKQIANRRIVEGQRVPEEVVREQHHFGVANRLIRMGVRGRTAGSVAIRGAIAERANGRSLHVLPWLGRAGLAIVPALLREGRALWSQATAMRAIQNGWNM
jgi:hypothetical protein